MSADGSDVFNVEKCSISRSRCTKKPLSVGLCLDIVAVGQLSALTDHLAACGGNRPQDWESVGVKGKQGKGGKWAKREGERGKGRKEEGNGGTGRESVP